MIFAHWMLSCNAGDNIGPWLVEQLAGEFPIWTDDREVSKVLLCGSILNHAKANTRVWGAGLASMKDSVLQDGLTICAVRGPLTRAIVLAHDVRCPEVYGDPALLTSRLVPRPVKPSGLVAVIPHYVDGPRCAWWLSGRTDVVVVNPLWPVERYVASVSSARAVVSSSLHGIILADAFGLPRCWASFSDSVGGDGTKFRDHDLAMGLPASVALDRRGGLEAIDFGTLPYVTVSPSHVRAVQDGLLRCCPFPIRGDLL